MRGIHVSEKQTAPDFNEKDYERCQNTKKYHRIYVTLGNFNPLETKRRLFYLKTQSVPRCKHFSSRL